MNIVCTTKCHHLMGFVRLLLETYHVIALQDTVQDNATIPGGQESATISNGCVKKDKVEPHVYTIKIMKASKKSKFIVQKLCVYDNL